ncbi:T9SS type A sorting domain-containing protein [Taibaiella lutea]|uniref:T9SS type A sorting domain-containing protein n=1 Tax=Taibaiella lutea TaxID=2608001 RepID=A0A5M6CCT8_9BACT|nr:peptide-N-glycosidase F-related protein [Taibaiella lutea]KAA5532270.1 T9SS type A sorting domain-containing protein [Taibaiella lutea]
MKKIYSLLLLAFGAFGVAQANPGDTTIVVCQQNKQMDWPSAGTPYDTAVVFPDGSKTYRKILLEFTLGKYACPGYDPSNPGEGAGQTGWCGDWDYDVHTLVLAPTDTLELARFITPYANTNFPRTPLTWRHPYVFDVTDYYPLLKNNAFLRIKYNGYSGGFTGSVRFIFIEGTPPRDVVKLESLWVKSSPYGNTSNPISTNITEKTLVMPGTAVSAEMKLIITGHGGDNTANCAEFCKKWYQVMVNGSMNEQKDIWRDDCGSNFLYPQSGTWIYDRGNWCPGDLVHDNIHKMPATVTPGSTFTTNLNFQSYTSGNNGASYNVAAGMFYYGGFNHTVDAGIENIVSPSTLEANYRYNPVCGQPVINVKNFGSSTLTSIKFSYGVVGQTMASYTWTGSMASLNAMDITLPSIPELKNVTGTNQFTVSIVEANGAADQDNFNNTMTTAFEAAPKWSGGHYRVDFKMSSNYSGQINKTNWTLKDMDGNTIASRQGTASSATYADTFHLANGCYRLDVENTTGAGLAFFTAMTTKGYFRIYNLGTGNKMDLPKTDLGNPGLEGNFGNGFTQYFTVQNSEVVGVGEIEKSTFSMGVYPNPAKDAIHIEVLGQLKEKAQIQLTNIVGQVVYKNETKDQNVYISTENIPNGIYLLSYTVGDVKKVEKVIVSK